MAQATLNTKEMVLAEAELWTTIAEDSKMELGEEVTLTKVEELKMCMTKKSKEQEEK